MSPMDGITSNLDRDAANAGFAPSWPGPAWRNLAPWKYRPEADCVRDLLRELQPTPEAATRSATAIVETLRADGRRGLVETLLREYSLSSQEGVALMCLAEALLRIPDNATRDRLIRDKIGGGDWTAHLGSSSSFFVNAATWGLFLTGSLQKGLDRRTLGGLLGRALNRGGEPLVRAAMNTAMGVLGRQFVVGETIEKALDAAAVEERQGFRYSFDMLGEAALTERDARQYLAEYQDAIRQVGAHNAGRTGRERAGVSVKLSALHPRYGRAQLERVRNELWPTLRDLALLAREKDVGLNIDAEEADRLELSLDLLHALCNEPALAGWDGIGFVVQAYGRRTRALVDALVALARDTGHRLMIRLVKGAYWDSEIKKAQEAGLPDYPVFTRKVHTDLSYLACAQALLGATDAVFPQFATHNAQTVAAVAAMAGPDWHPDRYEFQCLHGMGEPLYRAFARHSTVPRPCRIYAPVGTHQTLLAYLVRRLLENGANSSFVNRIADPAEQIADLVADPVLAVSRAEPVGAPHEAIDAPAALFGAERRNSAGLDLSDENTLSAIAAALEAAEPLSAEPILATEAGAEGGPWRDCADPADRTRIVGRCRDATETAIETVLGAAVVAAPAWAALGRTERAAALRRSADRLEADRLPLMATIMREAGKTAGNALGEVREAVDFLRYYAAAAAEDDYAPGTPLGVVACISPWNFPLAIFVGQIAAALAAGNVAVAKPAEETPLTAAAAVRCLLGSGLPSGTVQLLPGDGAVGAALVGDRRVAGVMFTGSTDAARSIARVLAGRTTSDTGPMPLVAETGGQNALVADSSALTEQVVADALQSAFDSAGQRCSALRVLCVQADAYDRVLRMLLGAIEELRVGDPCRLRTDVGPVISEAARDGIEAHVSAMRAAGHRVHRLTLPPECRSGCFVPPTVIEIDHIAQLGGEVFGPVLHVLRFEGDRLEDTIEAINRTGYGLTFGVHTRIDDTLRRAVGRSDAGNVYVNRNLIGAVVGSQPFGGGGLSGTGPKAGGPLILHRLRRAAGPGAVLPGRPAPAAAAFLCALPDTLREALAAVATRSPFGFDGEFPGPVGERNEYRLRPRGVVLCVADTDRDLAAQLCCALATGNVAAIRSTGAERFLERAIRAAEPAVVAEADAPSVDAVVATAARLPALAREFADRPGPIVAVHELAADAGGMMLEALMHEVSVCVNTTAAGGNASLMTLA
ncbi:MAG: bifunctional proline dehydrogenase/L-glutamate gamma-semialdehyde dehydrogenase PutA [Gluconacetobacter diazotrophicus]|nr:bifunctional proline dehydrogenase/L-glutamate gamma-semialdehyde dehydrogenase PutA [Gluconacetobacter diazotrophicus]